MTRSSAEPFLDMCALLPNHIVRRDYAFVSNLLRSLVMLVTSAVVGKLGRLREGWEVTKPAFVYPDPRATDLPNRQELPIPLRRAPAQFSYSGLFSTHIPAGHWLVWVPHRGGT